MPNGIRMLSSDDPEVRANIQYHWFIHSSLGMNLGFGSAFNNALSPMGPRRRAAFNKTASSIQNAVTGFQNEYGNDRVVPRNYGIERRIFPFHAANPYTLVTGQTQYLHALFMLGWGPLEVTDLRIGDTPIANYGTDIETEIKTGTLADTPISLFTQDVNEKQPNEAIVFGSKVSAEVGLCNYVTFDVYFPQGLYNLTTTTLPNGTQVTTRSARSLNLHVAIYETPSGVAVVDGPYTISENIPGPFVRTITIPLGALDDYIATIERAAAAGNGTTQIDAMTCISIKGVKYGSPVLPMYDGNGDLLPISYVAVRAKGGTKASGMLDAFNCKVSSILKSWDGAAWTEVKSNSPADIIADLLCGSVNPRPIPRAKLNGPAFALAKTFTTTKNFGFNHSFDEEGTIEDAIAAVQFASRLLYVPRDETGKHSIVIEDARETISQIITPLNSRNFKWTKTWGDIPHAIKAQWISPSANYKQEETIIPRPGYTKETATTFESVQFLGVQNYDQVYKLGLYQWACALNRPTIYEFEMPAEQLLARIGQRVKVTNDIIGYGLGEGRVVSVATNGGGDCTGVTVSEPLLMESNKLYAIRIRFSDNTSIYKQIVSLGGEQTVFTFTTPIDSADPQPEVDDLVQYSYLNQEADMIITSIEQQDDLTARVTCVDYSPEVYTADSGTIPNYDPPVSPPAQPAIYIPPAPEIIGILSDENVMIRIGNVYAPRIKVLYTIPASSRIRYVAAYLKRDDETEFRPSSVVAAELGEVYITEIQEGETYTIRLRSVGDTGYQSEPVENAHEVVGRRTPPPDLLNLYPHAGQIWIDRAAPPVDYSHDQIRLNFDRNTNWDQAQILIERQMSNSFSQDILPDGLITLLAKSFDTAGNASVNARSLTHDFGETPVENVYLQEDSQPTWTDCDIANGTVIAGEVVSDSNGTKFYAGGGAKFYQGVPSSKFYTQSYKALTVQRDYVPRGDITEPWILKLDYAVDAENYHVFVRVPGSDKFYDVANAGNKPFYSGLSGAKFYAGGTNSDWKTWNGERIGKKRLYQLKIECPGSTLQPSTVSRLGVIADMPDISEDFVNQVIGPSGTNLPLTKTYRQIKSCIPILQGDASYPTARRVEIDSPMPYDSTTGTEGPLLKVYDSSNAPTSGKVAGTVKGW